MSFCYLKTDCRRLNGHHHGAIAIATDFTIVVEVWADCRLKTAIVADATWSLSPQIDQVGPIHVTFTFSGADPSLD
jgi:hypothetical protein